MKTLSRHVVTPALVAITCTAVTGLVLRQVGALGIPATPTMYYRGTLDAPVGSHTVRVTLFDAVSGGSMRCQSDAVSRPPVLCAATRGARERSAWTGSSRTLRRGP